MKRFLILCGLCSLVVGSFAKADPADRYLWLMAKKEQRCQQNVNCNNLREILQQLGVTKDILDTKVKILNLQCESSAIRIQERVSANASLLAVSETPCARLVPNFDEKMSELRDETQKTVDYKNFVQAQLDQIYRN